MNTCSTCKHWGTGVGMEYEREHGNLVPGAKICAAVPHANDVREWKKVEGVADPVLTVAPEYIDTKAFAMDASDFVAYLQTMPDFGCVMHKPIEPQEDSVG